jgi:hypothetical protein
MPESIENSEVAGCNKLANSSIFQCVRHDRTIDDEMTQNSREPENPELEL